MLQQLTEEINACIEQQKYHFRKARIARRCTNDFLAEWHTDQCERIVQAKDVLIRQRSELLRPDIQKIVCEIPD